MRRLVLLSFVLLGGCAADAGSSSAPLETQFTSIYFDREWNEWTNGTLYAGRTIEVSYDVDRLPCRATRYSRPAWSIVIHYRVNGGPVSDQVIYGHEAYPGANVRTIVLSEPGTLELWFEASSASGCHMWDSNYGANYRFEIAADPYAPGWMGNEAWVISRAACDGGACDADRQPLSSPFSYGTWARERAAIRGVYFDVWKAGVTDWDNPDLWQQLDVRLHFRYWTIGDYSWAWIDQDGRVGNDARYVASLRELDPLGGPARTTVEECPNVPLTRDPTGMYVRTTFFFFFSVNGHVFRAPDGQPFRGYFEDYASNYAPCNVLTP